MPNHAPCAAALGASRVIAARHATRVDLWRCIDQAQTAMRQEVSTPMTLSRLAQEAGLSRWHFQRVFRQACGESAHASQRRMRLEAAYRLLADEGYRVGEACNAVGFSSVGSFCRSFRRRFGQSPGSVRNSQRRTTT